MSAYDCKNVVNTMLQAYGLLARGHVHPTHVSKWIKFGNQNLRLVRQLLRKSAVTVPEKQKYISTIGLLKGIQVRLKCLLKSGGDVRAHERRSDRVNWQDVECAFSDRIRSGVIVNLKHLDISEFMKDAQFLFQTRIKNALKRDGAVKVYTVLAAEYVITKPDKETVEIKYFNTKADAILPTTNIKEWFKVNVQQPIQKDMEEFQERESGWSLRTILNLSVHINKYNPMRGSSYIKLPTAIEKKHACINVKNFDDACFKWAVLAALHPVHRQKHPDRVSTYKVYENELTFTGMEFPVRPKQIPTFERLNSISVNVYILNKMNNNFTVAPLHITKSMKDRHVNLLLIQTYYADDEDHDTNSYKDSLTMYHYVCIRDLSRLVSGQVSKKKVKKYICNRCLHYFHSEAQLELHEQDCSQINECRVNLPGPKHNILEFKNFNNKERVPFVIYADFECLLAAIQDGNIYQKHEAFSVGYYFKCSYDDTLSYYRSFRGPNPAKWFAEQLLQLAENIETVFWCPLPMDALTVEQELSFENAQDCHICEKPLQDDRVRDHCHLTGR